MRCARTLRTMSNKSNALSDVHSIYLFLPHLPKHFVRALTHTRYEGNKFEWEKGSHIAQTGCVLHPCSTSTKNLVTYNESKCQRNVRNEETRERCAELTKKREIERASFQDKACQKHSQIRKNHHTHNQIRQNTGNSICKCHFKIHLNLMLRRFDVILLLLTVPQHFHTKFNLSIYLQHHSIFFGWSFFSLYLGCVWCCCCCCCYFYVFFLHLKHCFCRCVRLYFWFSLALISMCMCFIFSTGASFAFSATRKDLDMN